MNSSKWNEAKALFHEALDLTPAEREVFLSKNCDDKDLRREVEELLLNFEESDDFIKDSAVFAAGLVTLDESKVGEKIGNFEIIREIGRGGMGAVYLAVRADDEFNQQVALKIVKRGMDTDFIVNRFRTERQILASLNHPNIASLFEGGTTTDNLPYFVMEFVEGQDLITYCNQKGLDLNERLKLFREVCSAVSYAHQNLVVHRDLKPSNILVTLEGIPKLLDFGIAKILDPDSSEAEQTKTAGVFRLLTPEYASPEQIRGEKITTASDVYSLGVLLYQLLTGHSPYQTESKSYDEVINTVCKIEPIAPSSVIRGQWSVVRETAENIESTTDESQKESSKFQTPNPRSLKGDLDNIIIKALKKEPERRYSSVQEFSEDIRRHLVGLPVEAMADTALYRIGKFIKRHRAGVFAGCFMFISLLTGISVATWQAVEARNERDKAERRFNDVRKLSNSFLFEFHDAIENLSGATPARKLVIERALPFLDNLAKEAGNDDSLQNELAESYRKLGEIQGHPTFPNVGDVSGGIESFHKSIKIGEELVRRNRTNPEYRFNLAKYYEMLGDMYGGANYDTPNALANYQTSMRLREELRTENPHDSNLLKGLLLSYERVGTIKAKTGELSSAIKYYQASLNIAEQLQAREPGNNKLQRDIFVSYYEIGKVLQSEGKYQEALDQYEKGRILVSNSIAVEPNNPDLQRMIGISDDLSANCRFELGEINAATALSNNALRIREKLFAADPTNIQVYGDLTVSLDTAGDLLVKAGDIAGALKLLHRSLEMREAALKQDPTMTLAKRYIAVSHNKIANALRAKNDLTTALVNQQQALIGNRELSGADPTNLELNRELAASLQGTGETLALLAVTTGNRRKWLEARDLLEESGNLYNQMQTNNQAFGSDSAKITNIELFIEKYEGFFSR